MPTRLCYNQCACVSRFCRIGKSRCAIVFAPLRFGILSIFCPAMLIPVGAGLLFGCASNEAARAQPLSPAPALLLRPFPASDDSPKPRHKPRKAVGKSEVAENTPASNAPQSPLVRVCLLRYAGSSQITVNALPGARLLGAQGREVASGAGPWTFKAAGSGIQVSDAKSRRLGALEGGQVWRVQVEDPSAQFGVRGGGGATRHYHGSLEIRNAGGALRLINEVGMEPYLQGVVISEIGDGPLEALKAQVIAARTYAISSRGRWKSDGYDLRDSVDSQAYGGIEAETADGNRSVQTTTGQILTVNGQAIDSDFCDDCGGVTAPGEDANVLPRSVSDEEAHRYIRHSPHGVWTLNLSPDRLKTLLGRSSKARGKGTLQNIEIARRDVSGRAERVRFTWGQGKSAAPVQDNPDNSPPPNERSTLPSRHAPLKRRNPTSLQTSGGQTPDLLSGPSATPTTTTEINGETLRGLIGYDVLRSTLFTIRRATDGSFVFEGHGWGHGHGLCQQGALALAALPLNRDCKTILAHYYPGALLTRWTCAEEEGSAALDADTHHSDTETQKIHRER